MPNIEAKYDNEYDSIGIREDLYKAEKNKDIEAQYNLALYYQYGIGTEKNLEKALYWYQKAAESGHITAQYNYMILV